METKQRLTILDSLRGLAAVGVVFFWHYQHFINTDAQIISNYPFSRLFHWFYAYGWILVDLFFVLSGFILCHNYTEKIADKLINFRQFMLYRLSRLYPLVVLTTIIVLIIQKIRIAYGLEYFVYQTNNFFHFIVNIFLLQGIIPEAKSFNAPSWAVSIEVLLYILLFIGIKFFYKKKYSFYTSMILLGFILQRFEDSIMMLSLISRGLNRIFCRLPHIRVIPLYHKYQFKKEYQNKHTKSFVSDKYNIYQRRRFFHTDIFSSHDQFVCNLFFPVINSLEFTFKINQSFI